MSAAPKPNLYRGQQVPFEILQPDQFESFIYSTLEYIGPLHNFRILGQPANTGDGGFDAYGEFISDSKKGQIICVQCKRYTSNLQLSHISTELAKVALRSQVEKSKIKEHYFISAGDVSQELYSAHREVGRNKIITASVDRGINSNDLKALREQVRNDGHDVADIITKYILDLDNILIWSGRDYDSQLGRVWSKLGDLLEKFFSIEIALKEYPRPDFNVSKYISECRNSKSAISWTLPFVDSELPHNLYIQQKASFPTRTETANLDNQTKEDITKFLITGNSDAYNLLTGVGGAGKTTALLSTLDRLADEFECHKSDRLPVFISLDQYKGDLRRLINDRLGLIYGTWESLPGPFMLLLDGLDEIHDSALIQGLLDELHSLSNRYKLNIIISMRSSGLRRPITIKSNIIVCKIHQITIRHIKEIARSEFSDISERRRFLEEIYARLDWTLLSTALGVRLSIDIFKNGAILPAKEQELIQRFLAVRLNRNLQRSGLNNQFAELPAITITSLLEFIAFEFRIEQLMAINNRSISLTQSNFSILQHALERAKLSGIFGVDSINDLAILQIAQHFELLTQINGNILVTSHDLIMDFLASYQLAHKWRDCLSALESAVADDAWIFASAKISKKDIIEFLEAVANADLLLAARCAVVAGSTAISHLENLVFRQDQIPGLRAGYVAARAMGILASSKCIEKLRERMMDADRDRRFQGMRELVRIGDKDVVLQVFDIAEKDTSAEGITISGGEGGLFEYVPTTHALELCRNRLRQSPSSREIVLSLEMIQTYGDETDLIIVEQALYQASTLTVFFAAVRCMKAINPAPAIQYLEMLSKDPSIDLTHKIYIEESLALLGGQVNSWKFLELVLDTSKDFPIRSRASKLIEENEPWNDMASQLKTSYDSADMYGRSLIWSIAQKHQLSTFDDVAFDVITSRPDEEAGYAANFAGHRQWDTVQEERFSTEIMKLVLGPAPQLTYCWHTFRILQYLLNRRREAAEIIFTKLQRLILAHGDIEDGVAVPELGIYNKHLGIALGGNDNHGIEFAIQHLLPMAGQLADHVSDSVVDALLDLRMGLLPRECLDAFRKLIAKVSDRRLDEKLIALKHHRDRIVLLSNSGRESTSVARIDILRQAGSQLITMPMMKDEVQNCIMTLWCSEVLTIMIEAVISYDWADDERGYNVPAQMFRNIMEAVGNRITKTEAQAIIHPNMTREMAPLALEILQFWYECGISHRGNS